jgi:hypothetical protein
MCFLHKKSTLWQNHKIENKQNTGKNMISTYTKGFHGKTAKISQTFLEKIIVGRQIFMISSNR